MFIYIFNFLLLALTLFRTLKFDSLTKKLGLFILILYFSWFIGFRYNVGGDWQAYLTHYENLTFDDFFEQLLLWDPAYIAIEYFSKYLGFGIWGVNTICALIFLLSFIYFINTFSLKVSYSFFIAYPYLMMVVVNGYSRQGIAIGLVMLFYALLYKNKMLKAIFALFFASLFHKTAIIAGIVALIYKIRFSIKNLIYILILILTIFVVYTLFQDKFEIFIKYYWEDKMQSTGGIIRVMINIYASVLLFIVAKKYIKYFDDYDLWKIFGYISFLMLFIAIYFKITTVADRLLLYFYPLQIVVFQRVLFIIKDKNLKFLYFYILFLLYFGMLIVWINFAIHRFYWIPYDNFLFRYL